jgi:hypothetical protein
MATDSLSIWPSLIIGINIFGRPRSSTNEVANLALAALEIILHDTRLKLPIVLKIIRVYQAAKAD